MKQEVITRVRDAALMPGTGPVLSEDALLLEIEHFVRNVVLLWQGERALHIGLAGLAKRGHISLLRHLNKKTAGSLDGCLRSLTRSRVSAPSRQSSRSLRVSG